MMAKTVEKKAEKSAQQNEQGKSLPDGWRWVKLGDIAKLERGKFTPRPRNDPRYYGGKYPWIQTGEVEQSGKYITTYRNTLNNEGLAVSRLFSRGTLVITIAATIGAVGILNFDSCMPDSLVGVVPKSDITNTDFLYYLLLLLRNDLKAIAPQLAQANLNLRILNPLLIPLPPIGEQKRIVEILSDRLSTIEQARQATEAQLEAAQALPTAYLRQIFNSPEAQKWEKKYFREICVENGQYGTSQRANIEGKGLPVLRMGNIIDGQIDWSDLKFIDLPTSESNKYRLKEGDIVFNRTNSAELVGKTAVFDGQQEAIFASYLIRFQLLENVADSDFVTFYINSSLGRKFIEAHMSRAIGQVNISASAMHKMPVPTPSIQVQRQASSFLKEKLEQKVKLCKLLQDQLDTINALPAALLRQAFNGEL